MLSLAALAAVGIAWTYHHLAGPHSDPCAPVSPPFGVFHHGRECVGVTNGSYVFAPALENVEHDIAAQNAQAVRTKHYVTVALLTPLSLSSGSVVSMTRIQDELEGAYAAQFNANSSRLEDVYPRIQLVLANEGSQEQAWQQVAGQLKSMTGSPAHLVAVIGMGVSVTQTVDGAQALSHAGIPMIGSVLTGDNLDWSHIAGLARVMPSDSAQVAALGHYLAAHGGLRDALLVSDTNSGDLYTANLADDFRTVFGKYVKGHAPYGPSPEIGNEFNNIASIVCPALSGTPPMVIYAGREVVLPQFIRQLEESAGCARKRLTVVTGSDAAALPDSITDVQPDQGQVTVIYSNLASPARVTYHTRRIFEESRLGSAASLGGTWTIATYDAMAAAARVISLATGPSSELPPPALVQDDLLLLKGPHSVLGATGPFSIGANGDVFNQEVPVMKLAAGSAPQLVSP